MPFLLDKTQRECQQWFLRESSGLCDDNDTVGAEGSMLTTMKLLGTHYAFMLP